MPSWVKEELGFDDQQRLLVKLTTKVKIFNGLTTAEVSKVLAHAEKCTFETHATIVSEGNTGNYTYFILKGNAVVSKTGREGPIELAQLGPADSFGEMALVDQTARSATVKASSPCVLIRISANSIDAYAAIAAKIYHNMASVLAARLREADELLAWRL